MTEQLETTAAVFGSVFAAVLLLAAVATLVGTGMSLLDELAG